MAYVVKLGTNVSNWTWFRTYDAAARYASPYGLVPELNLTHPYDY